MALKWYHKASEQGDLDAQSSLGFMYAKGRGVRKDVSMAAKWYRKAAERGHAQAQSGLARMYAMGEGVPKDCVEAHKWFSLAASRAEGSGAEAAANERDRFARTMNADQISQAQRLALEWKPK